MKVLNITTSDGGNFKVDWDVARQSQTIRTMLDDLSIDEDSNNEDTIPLANKEVTRAVFEKSLIWMKHNRGEPDFQEDTDDDELKPKEFVRWSQLDEWQKNYINIPVSEMFPLLIVGNFLEIKGLVNLMVKAVALQIQGKSSAEEIRKMFNIEDPKWTPEELQNLKDEHAWAYETKK
jgi:S-phase kinase-associated protein 1